jgi:hypothetical protein
MGNYENYGQDNWPSPRIGTGHLLKANASDNRFTSSYFVPKHLNWFS